MRPSIASLLTLAFLICAASHTRGDDSTTDVQLRPAPFDGRRARAVVDHEGAEHLIYANQGNLFYTRRDVPSDDYTQPIQVNSIDRSIAAANLAVAPDGTVHVVFHGNIVYVRNQIQAEGSERRVTAKDIRYTFYSRLPTGAEAFEPQRNISGSVWGFDGSCAVAADAENVYVFINGAQQPGSEMARDIFLVRSTDGGDQFEAPRGVGLGQGVCACCHLSALVDDAGALHFIYRVALDRVDRNSYAMRSTDQGATFESIPIDTWKLNACPGSAYSFATSGDQTLVSWRTVNNIFFKPLDAEDPISPGGQVALRRAANLALRPDGVALMAWAEGANFNKPHDLRWQKYGPDGNPVGDPGILKDAFARWGNPEAFVDANGAFVILY